MPTKPFAAFAKNVTSQFGEDGILEELFKRLGTTTKLCVEFGAWDGKHFSNTWKLWHEEGWSAILIESVHERVEALNKDLVNYPKVKAVEGFVKPRGPQSLDAMLPPLIGDQVVDLMSIDIDSDDGVIFAELETYQPRVAIVEYNPTIPPSLELMQEEGEYFGSSAKALDMIAKKKGYTLVAMTTTNCFFVKNSEVSKLQLETIPTLEDLFLYEHLTYIVSSYAGKLFTTRKPLYFHPLHLMAAKNFPRVKGNHGLLPIRHLNLETIPTLLWQKLKEKFSTKS